MKTDVLIVGAGFCGAVLAQQLASVKKKRVLIIDKRPHLGGNAYDEKDAHGILVHRYGPHIFHTSSSEVRDYLSAFTSWRPYEHRVLSLVQDKLYPFPINRLTLNKFYGLQMETDEEAMRLLEGLKVPMELPRNAEEKVLSQVGKELYAAFFKDYTFKQWGCDPCTLSPAITSRIPVRFNCDDRYFTDSFQAMPKDGYAALFQNLLDHPLIEIQLGATFAEMEKKISFDHLIYTGTIDEYFHYCYGKLPYRSLRFEWVYNSKSKVQPCATLNYPDQRPYTRSTEFKHLTGQKCLGSTLCFEYPKAHITDDDERHYPVLTVESSELYRRYLKKARRLKKATFCGRLGDYKYYNMDHAILRALRLFKQKFTK